MLTEGQQKYLSKLPPERADSIVEVKPYDPYTEIIAQEVIGSIKELLPEADIRFMGASALGIPGQNDVDIYIICPKDLKEEYTLRLGKIFGNQIKNKWQWIKDGYEVSVYLSNPDDKKFKEQLDIFEIFIKNPQLLKEYEELKNSMNGKTYAEYQRSKYEFYNRVLNIVKEEK